MDKAGSLNRASLILAAIARGSRKGSLLTELTQRTGLPRTTVVRTLDNLLELGWVIRTSQETRFNLGRDLAGLGYSAISRNPLERIASVELSQLAVRLDQMVYLVIRSNLDVVCIGRYECKSEIQIGRGSVGLRGPFGMTQSCMGMLSRLPEEEVRAIIEANLPRFYRIEGFDESGFRRTVKEAQRNGYGTFDNIILDRTTSGIGVAIMDSTGDPIAGIGTTYLTGWLDETGQKKCLRELQQAAADIEAKLIR